MAATRTFEDDTVTSFVEALKAGGPLSDDLMVVREADGTLREFTSAEKEALGITHPRVDTGLIEGAFPLYGRPGSPLQIVIAKRA